MSVDAMTYPSFLKLSAAHDATDKALALEVAFVRDGFSGHGTAYFSADQLTSTAEKLCAYPIPPQDSIVLEGGYFEPDQPGILREKHVSLRVIAGDLSPIELHVGAGAPWSHKQGLQHWAEVTFPLDYEQLTALSMAIDALANGESDAVTIDLSTFG